MQASIEIKNGIIYAKAPKGLQATDFTFGVISVTGTENIVMAATLANGTSVLRNCAVEPEVTNLIKVLNEMGAKITGIGTETLTIEGVKKLSATKPHKVVADRIEAGTFLAMAAATGKEIVLKGITSELMAGILDAFKRMGFSFSINDEKQEITMHAEDISTLKSIDLSTAPYPRFPTDIQAQFCVLNCLTQGNSSITETIFENRFLYCEELNKMGAKLKIDKKTCNIIGGIKFYGAKVRSTDLRASASLAIAALVATGETEIYDIYHLDRGYERIEEKMLNLGVTIHRKSI
jgi:UDP-N-acetylglucosamine 1-carboxyvinyltransferase